MSYTKGPWRVSQYRDQVETGEYTNESLVMICNIQSPSPRGPSSGVSDSSNYKTEREANARLIAAAPELLNALEEYVRDLPENDKSYYGMLFKALITKAEGGDR